MGGKDQRQQRAAVVLSGRDRLEYTVRYSKRRTLGLYVFRDGRVEVRVPPRCPDLTVESFLRERLDWVQRKRAEFAARPAPAPAPGYGEGAAHPFLGDRYPLRLQVAGGRGRVRLVDAELWVEAPDVERPQQVAGYLDAWYRRQAQELFPQRLEQGYQGMAHYGIVRPELKIRRMKSRWGSCSSRGSVTLNLELIKFPLVCLDYVIAHELCHLLEFNHSPRFYALMDAVMPDWRQRRALLNAGGPLRAVD